MANDGFEAVIKRRHITSKPALLHL